MLTIIAGMSHLAGYYIDLFDVSETLKWTCLPVKGSVPQCRRHHTASVINDKMYIIGGEAGEVSYTFRRNRLKATDQRDISLQLQSMKGRSY